jgi:hypothetical protein
MDSNEKKVYYFEEQLVISTGTAANRTIGLILKDVFPGTHRVMHSLEVHDKKGVDWWLEMDSGERIGVDCKILNEDPTHKFGDNLPLETWSVVGKKVGWTLDHEKITDYVFWFWKDTGRWCYLPFQPLLIAFTAKKDEWVKEFRVAQQNTENKYKSECVFVPRVEIWREIYRQSSGKSADLQKHSKNNNQQEFVP